MRKFHVEHTGEAYIVYINGIPVGIADTVDGVERLLANPGPTPREPNPRQKRDWKFPKDRPQ